MVEAGNVHEGISLSAPVIMELIEAVHEKGAPFRFKAAGFSMIPAIRDGDFITLSPLGDILPGHGDVVAFRHPERPRMLVHRVLWRGQNSYFMRGDNCPEADGWVPTENLLGLVTRVERGGKPRFWPNRMSNPSWAPLFLSVYLLWLPQRRILAAARRRLRRAIRRGR